MELTGLYLTTSWMILSSTSPASFPLLSFLLILTKGLRIETHMPKLEKSQQPPGCPWSPPVQWLQSQASPAST